MHKELPTEVIFEGDPVDPIILEAAGIEKAHVLAACTTNDETNLALCYFVRERYRTKRTIARVNNPRNAWLFDKKFHVDVALNQADILARLIEEEMSMGDMMTLMKLRRGNYSLVEEKIPKGAEAIGIAIKEFKASGALRHRGYHSPWRSDDPQRYHHSQGRDEVLAVTNTKGAEQLAKLFNPPAQG